MASSVYPLVTIGIPTYNRADSYLKQTLESAVSQTYPNVEIIVSDNCSTDNTEALVKSLADPRIRYFKQARNIPANDNFNFCLEQAKGDYFSLLHDDDMIDEDFVDVCMNAAGYKTDIGLIRTGIRRIDSYGEVFRESPNLAGGLSTEEFFLAWFAGGKTPMHLCSTLFNTKRLREIGGFNSRHQLFQDVMAEVQLAAKFGRLDIRDVKASFRSHAATRTHGHKVSAWCEDSLMLLEIMCDLAPENKALIRREGMRFFIKHNYRLTSQVKSPIDRFTAYLIVFRKFDYPVGFFVSKMLRPMRRVSRRVRERVSSGKLFSSNVQSNN